MSNVTSVSNIGVDDCTELDVLTSEALCKNLELRFNHVVPILYTWVGSVLLSVNPYKICHHLYTEDIKNQHYSSKERPRLPHIYAVAEQCYRRATKSRKLNCNNTGDNKTREAIIITGESGSGKTEACQVAVSYFEYASFQQTRKQRKNCSEYFADDHEDSYSVDLKNSTSSRSTYIQNLLSKAGRILEVFGNAKTHNNQNSSRFGKLTTIGFTSEGSIAQARVQTYLLGKARVTNVLEGQQTFHSFHLFLDKISYLLKNNEDISPICYNYVKSVYTSKDISPSVPSHLNICDTLNALNQLKFSAEEQTLLWETLLGILELGNISFESKMVPGGIKVASISDRQPLERAAQLLRLGDPGIVEQALINQEIYDQVRQLSLEKALENRDALSRLIYEQLFNYIVSCINRTLGGKSAFEDGLLEKHDLPEKKQTTKVKVIAEIDILDIYGFEQTQATHNSSFEQFCINYANEKLQQYFASKVLISEAALYKKEGLQLGFASQFKDTLLIGSQDIINFFEGSSFNIKTLTLGAFHILKDSANIPGITDRDLYFCQNVLKLQREQLHRKESAVGANDNSPVVLFQSNTPTARNKKNNSAIASARNQQFAVAHSFSPVIYDAKGFIRQDKDGLTKDLKVLLVSSNSPLFNQIISPHYKTGDIYRLDQASIGVEFVSSVKKLLKRLETAQNSMFIRCFKPNNFQIPGYFNMKDVKWQMEYSGMLQTLEIMKHGFPCRLDYAAILQNIPNVYSSVCLVDKMKPPAIAEMLLGISGAPKHHYALGVTKIFFRHNVLPTVEWLLHEATHSEFKEYYRKYTRRRLKGLFLVVWVCIFLKRQMRRIKAAIVIQSTWRYLRVESAFINDIQALELLQALIRKYCATQVVHQKIIRDEDNESQRKSTTSPSPPLSFASLESETTSLSVSSMKNGISQDCSNAAASCNSLSEISIKDVVSQKGCEAYKNLGLQETTTISIQNKPMKTNKLKEISTGTVTNSTPKHIYETTAIHNLLDSNQHDSKKKVHIVQKEKAFYGQQQFNSRSSTFINTSVRTPRPKQTHYFPSTIYVKRSNSLQRTGALISTETNGRRASSQFHNLADIKDFNNKRDRKHSYNKTSNDFRNSQSNVSKLPSNIGTESAITPTISRGRYAQWMNQKHAFPSLSEHKNASKTSCRSSSYDSNIKRNVVDYFNVTGDKPTNDNIIKNRQKNNVNRVQDNKEKGNYQACTTVKRATSCSYRNRKNSSYDNQWTEHRQRQPPLQKMERLFKQPLSKNGIQLKFQPYVGSVNAQHNTQFQKNGDKNLSFFQHNLQINNHEFYRRPPRPPKPFKHNEKGTQQNAPLLHNPSRHFYQNNYHHNHAASYLNGNRPQSAAAHGNRFPVQQKTFQGDQFEEKRRAAGGHMNNNNERNFNDKYDGRHYMVGVPPTRSRSIDTYTSNPKHKLLIRDHDSYNGSNKTRYKNNWANQNFKGYSNNYTNKMVMNGDASSSVSYTYDNRGFETNNCHEIIKKPVFHATLNPAAINQQAIDCIDKTSLQNNPAVHFAGRTMERLGFLSLQKPTAGNANDISNK